MLVRYTAVKFIVRLRSTAIATVKRMQFNKALISTNVSIEGIAMDYYVVYLNRFNFQISSKWPKLLIHS